MNDSRTDRKLPEPIKPRVLKRYRDGTGTKGYITTDGRYLFLPADGGFVVLDAHTRGGVAGVRPLAEHRARFCAPGGKVPWLVCDMDDGIVRVEPTRADAVRWVCDHKGARVLGREPVGDGWYNYRIGYSREDYAVVWVARADVVHWQGFDPEQEPWFPYPDAPHEVGPRGLRANEDYDV